MTISGLFGNGPRWNWSTLRPATLHDLHVTERNIMAKLAQLAAVLDAITLNLEKVKVEVQALKDSLGNVDLPQDALDALERLSTAVKAVDDINPDSGT